MSPAENPPEPPAAPLDLPALLQDLRVRVDERRRSGAYPPGLEHDLDVHFRHIVEHRPVRDMDALHKAMASFEEHLTFDARDIPTGSRVPGGAVLHRGVAKLVTRETGWLAQALQDFAESVRVILWKMIETLDSPTHVHSDLTAQIDALLDRVAYYETVVGGGPPPPGPEPAEGLKELLGDRSPALVLDAAGPEEARELLSGTDPATLRALAFLGGPPSLAALIERAAVVLVPGGRLVVDPVPSTLHPARLAFLLRGEGFADLAVTFISPGRCRVVADR